MIQLVNQCEPLKVGDKSTAPQIKVHLHLINKTAIIS